jgi:hypothetical protein
VIPRHLLAEIDNLFGWVGVIEEGHPNVSHRLLGSAKFEQAREQLLFRAGSVPPWTSRLTPPRSLEQRD